MRTSLRLGSIAGIPLGINYTWFLIFFIITVSLALHYFPLNFPRWSWPLAWGVGLATSLLFFASVLAHELSHSIVAQRSGIPVRGITLFIFGGVSQISRDATRPRTELIMAAAGPALSLALGAVFLGVRLAVQGVSEPLAALADWLWRINVLLALFNLVPGFPLDGGRVLRALLWGATGNFRRATRIASLAGRGVAYALILLGVVIIFRGDIFGGLWLAFIGWFLENAASGSYRQTMFREALQGVTAAALMTRDCPLVTPGLTVGALVRDHLLYTGRRCFLVTEGERLEGLVTLRDIRGLPQGRWEETPLAQVMTPRARLQTASPDEDAQSILERMDEGDINQMPVVDGERVVGIIARDSLLHFIRTRSELGV